MRIHPSPGGLILTLSCILLSACSAAGVGGGPRPPLDALQRSVAAELEGFRGKVGVYVKDLASGDAFGISGNEVMPTASMIKVPILVTLFDQIAAGAHGLQDKLTYTEDRLYAGEDLLGSFRDGEPITLDKLVWLMITMSDNTASLWLQELVGTGTAVNEKLAALGFEHTRVNSRTPGREGAQQQFGWGQTTAREMGGLMEAIVTGQVAPPAETLEMRRVLSRSFWDDEALSVIPPEVAVASKQGAVSGSRSEVLLVHAPGGDYVLCIITDDQEDRSWEADNEGWQLIRRVSELCYQHFAG